MKLKTHKTTAKKIKVTNSKKRKNKKFLTIHAGRDHFNARESGNTTRNKRRPKGIADADYRNIDRLIPYK